MDEKLIEQFFSNKCNLKETEELAAYFEKNEHELDRIKIFEDLQEYELLSKSSFTKRRIYRSFPFLKSGVGFTYLKGVAAVLLVGTFSFFIWKFSLKAPTLSIKDDPEYVVNNQDNTYKLITLPDNSTLLLWPQARISYKKSFLKKRFVKQLYGKVKYSITPNNENPFITRYENIETKVLGTVFTIHEARNRSLSIDLSQGKVWIQDVGRLIKPIILDKNGRVLIDRQTLTYERVAKNTELLKNSWAEESRLAKKSASQGISEWTNDHIKLNGLDNVDFVDLIERIYNVQIIIKRSSILNGNFTGSVLYNEDLKILLESFCETNGCTYRSDSHIIYLE
ncbi:FecR family protein [Sphingobacterium sp. UBA1498]|uniref:FecR family protein n=1 Tax=Sphingobacterium sp. UBA1498 TaxID=1947481 RepID=UPI0025EDB840|nr:FecR family protein [Sphingobacterium sp. UBA1498]